MFPYKLIAANNGMCTWVVFFTDFLTTRHLIILHRAEEHFQVEVIFFSFHSDGAHSLLPARINPPCTVSQWSRMQLLDIFCRIVIALGCLFLFKSTVWLTFFFPNWIDSLCVKQHSALQFSDIITFNSFPFLLCLINLLKRIVVFFKYYFSQPTLLKASKSI